ncbi:MAG TPA: nucleoid-associated protein [Erysipelothrix sp.]|nr:nucleoid-associated protein [Erysipelothrix sp.]
MQVTKVVVHSVDNSLETVILSKQQINLNQNAELDQLIIKFYKGINNSTNSHDALIKEDSLLKNKEDIAMHFMKTSTDIAAKWFDLYETNTRHTALNLIFALIQDEEKISFVMFEVVSRGGFVRVLEDDANEIEYSLGVMSDSLASVKNAFVYELNEESLKVRHTIDSQEYLEEILGFETIPNTKRSLEILDAMVDYVSEKREADVYKNAILSKQMILENSELFETVEPETILENVFDDLDDEETEFIKTTIEETKMKEEIPSDQVGRLKARKKHRLETDSGIVITLPLDSLEINQVLEVIDNPDGTKDIILKNVGMLD